MVSVESKLRHLVSGPVPFYFRYTIWRRLWLLFKLLVLATGFCALIAPEWPDFGGRDHRLNAIVGLRQFDFLLWESSAIGAKAEAILADGQSYLDTTRRKEIVLRYLELVGEVGQLERQIENVFSDSTVTDPAGVTAAIKVQLEEKRRDLSEIQPIAEAIVQDQVADILVEEGFDILGQVWPPVMMHMTPLPSILIISPRDRIQQIRGISLIHGISTEEKELLESAVFEELDLSALVVPIGGLGIYPSMITETGDINRLADVVAHEWAHHWMGPYPISLYYTRDPEVRTMNETIASILGNEIGARMVRRYYPEFAPTPAPESAQPSGPTAVPVFDFRAELAQTRMKVDDLLVQGKIEEAEQYMELRRQFLQENGYAIRKINQAYFAFYGAYADEPGAAGGDPIGPMLLELRQRSPSIRAFMRAIAPINSRAELEEVLAGARSEG